MTVTLLGSKNVPFVAPTCMSMIMDALEDDAAQRDELLAVVDDDAIHPLNWCPHVSALEVVEGRYV